MIHADVVSGQYRYPPILKVAVLILEVKKLYRDTFYQYNILLARMASQLEPLSSG